MALAMIPALEQAAAATTESDARVAAGVKKSFVYRHYLKNDAIDIAAKDGVVTLTGTVSEDYHKTMAEEIAGDQHGVKSVVDHLEVKTPAPSAGSDAWLITRIDAALLFHRSVSAVDTKVAAKDGVVTLTGRADTQAQLDLTTEYARDIDGVKSVVNQMTVAKAAQTSTRMEDKMDDASITSSVKLTLLLHRSTSALHTKVSTSKGVVTLSGKARSEAEKALAEKITADVNGVTRVRNLITVS
jgi:osmotically-inducible protein OsmY